MIASNISCALVTCTILTSLRSSKAVGPATKVTLAPSALAALAIAYPCLPLEWLLKKRTGSKASCVGPAETKTFFPFNVCSNSNSWSMADTISCTSESLPFPVSLHAKWPTTGSTNL